jgi:ABC-type hemin transport system ATPase subunit
MRIVVRGPNGAGKSTLLSALSGKLTPIAGSRTEGDGLELGITFFSLLFFFISVH